MSTELVVIPHPDDETLGRGGTPLRHRSHGDAVHWQIVTDMRADQGYPQCLVNRRQSEIAEVTAAYAFIKVHNLGLPPATLNTLPGKDLVAGIGQVIREVRPSVVYLPFNGDVHSDHAAVFAATASCTKWFRYPSIRRILCYETLSETDFSLNPEGAKFAPNSFVDIADYIDRKIEIARIYQGEMGEFPFPHSPEALRALAKVRGAACGCQAAESFMLLREINK